MKTVYKLVTAVFCGDIDVEVLHLNLTFCLIIYRLTPFELFKFENYFLIVV